jgi:hypothetical protein
LLPAPGHGAASPGYDHVVEPIPETLEAIGELGPALDDGTQLEQLRHRADVARSIAPDLVGVSVALRVEGLTFTLVSSDDTAAALDGVQYAAGGPCLDALDAERGMATDAELLLSESRWQAMARASAAVGIRSTVTFPVLHDEDVAGAVNLYGRSDDAFKGRLRLLAAVFGAWAPGAVSNADLSFSTRRLAERAPQQLRDLALIDTAVGVVAASQDLGVEAAREHLEDAALRAGVTMVELARMIVENWPGRGL